MADGFLGRWSRKKLGEEEAPLPLPQPSPASGRGSEEAPAEPPPPLPPPPTLEDVQLLTIDSDFSRFITPDVAPEVKNAAMRKLFADPRYNVMDRLDTYIDDYSQPDPLPESMLRQLVSAKFLGFFADEEEKAPAPPRDVADDHVTESMAQSPMAPPAVTEAPLTHADPDLRLQQDDAAAGPEPGRGPE